MDCLNSNLIKQPLFAPKMAMFNMCFVKEKNYVDIAFFALGVLGVR